MSLLDKSISKPFPEFKWRWMEFAPVESFNRPDIFLGVVRAIGECEGLRASDDEFIAKLSEIQEDLDAENERVNLVPSDNSRNVIRRQGRYWTGLGVLARSSDGLALTSLGKDLADGKLAADEFVTDRIFNHTLPNALIDTAETISNWERLGIKFQPLLIILKVLGHLSGLPEQCFLTPDDVFRVIVPLSGAFADVKTSEIADAILDYRASPGKVDVLPDCVPLANDKRMVREHLLFLKNFGVLREVLVSDERLKYKRERYHLDDLGTAILNSFEFGDLILDNPYMREESAKLVETSSPHAGIDYGSVRRKRIANVTTRPNQAKFRKAVIVAFGGACILTGERVLDVIDACHIVDHASGGPDSVENSLCLRTDLHTLFDRGKLRISSDGAVLLAADVAKSAYYSSLPSRVKLPDWISRDFLRRKFKYGSSQI